MSTALGLIILMATLLGSAITLGYLYTREKQREIEEITCQITSFLEQQKHNRG